jgi:hypothetical protein
MRIKEVMKSLVSMSMVSVAMAASPLRAADMIPAGNIDFTTGAKPPVDATGFSIHIEPAKGVPNGTLEKGLNGNQIYVSKDPNERVTRGELKAGDVILGVEGKRFEKDVINTWRAAVGRASAGDSTLWFTRWRTGQVTEVKLRTGIPPGDFTKGGDRNDTHDWTLGPTGARGWIWGINLETTRARQILITKVEAGSPADGILQEGDVILGVTGALFTNDARLVFANAITEAEKTENKGQLRILRWRKGDQKDVVIPLKVLGSYSPTAPFNCPKTDKIVEAQCAYLLKHGFGDGVVRDINALGALATGRPEFAEMLKAHADKIAPPGLKLNFDDGSGSAWSWGYHNLFLIEYYLMTKDSTVLPAIREYSVNIAKGQSGAGNWGHGMAQTAYNGGKMHGPLGGYGAMNQPGLVCFLSLILSRECGVKDPEVDDAIMRSVRFFGSYVNRGSIVYGDHPPGESHDDNGKSSIGAVAFDVLGDKQAATFFSRMSVASWSVRESGHTGNFFSFLWGALGAARSGAEAAAAYMNELRWFVDLERRWDGSSVYQGGAGRGGSEHVYGNWDCTGSRLLANSLPLKKLRITGKGPGVAEPLSGQELKDVIDLDRGLLHSNRDTLYETRSADELFRLLGSWSPPARVRAAKILATRKEPILPQLLKLVEGSDRNAQYGACLTLQYMKEGAAEAVPTLTKLSSNPDLELRIRAITALASIGDGAKPAIPELLQLALKTTDDDPRELTQRALSSALFAPPAPGGSKGLLAEMDQSVDRKLVLRVVERLLQNQDGASRSVVSTIYPKLKFEEFQAIFPAVCKAIVEPSPSGEMGSAGVRDNGLKWLAENHVKEGLPMIMHYARNQQGWGSQVRMAQVMKWLERYGIYAQATLPELRKLADWCRTEPNFPKDCRTQKTETVEAAIRRIEATTTRPELKSISGGNGLSSQ